MTDHFFSPTAVLTLVSRFAQEYKQLWKTLLFRDLLDRLLFLVAFGFGMGGTIASMGGMPYLNFLVPGIAAAAGVMIMTMAMTFGAFERFRSYQLWQSWLATPLKLQEIMLAELIYAALRGLPSILIMLVLAYFLGALPSISGAVLSLPILLLANLTYGAIGLCFTSHITRHLHFAYVNTLWTMPMFLFSGVFFDLATTPPAMQIIANLLPLTHVINVVRPLMTNTPMDPWLLAADLGFLTLLFIAAFSYARYQFDKRLRS